MPLSLQVAWILMNLAAFLWGLLRWHQKIGIYLYFHSHSRNESPTSIDTYYNVLTTVLLWEYSMGREQYSGSQMDWSIAEGDGG